MYDICNIDTGEVIKTFEGFEYRWYDDGKRRAKKWIKDNGYEFVRVEYTRHGLTVWVKEV